MHSKTMYGGTDVNYFIFSGDVFFIGESCLRRRDNTTKSVY